MRDNQNDHTIISSLPPIKNDQKLACEQALPRAEMRACNNHGGKSINGSLGENPLVWI